PEETCDVLLHAEGLPVEGPSHVEAPVATVEAPIAERDHDVGLRHELPVEPGDPGGHGQGLLSIILFVTAHAPSRYRRSVGMPAVEVSLTEPSARDPRHCGR